MGRVQTRSSRKPDESYPLKSQGKEALSHSAPSICVRRNSGSGVEKDQRGEQISCTEPKEPEEKGSFRDLSIVETSNTDFTFERKNSQEELYSALPDKLKGERLKEGTGAPLAIVTQVSESEDVIKVEKKRKSNSAFTVNDPAKENRSPEKISVLGKDEDRKVQTISTAIGVKQEGLKLLKATETMVIEQRNKLDNVSTVFDDECDREVNEIISSGRSSASASVKNLSPSPCNKDEGLDSGRLSSDSLSDLPLLEGCFSNECTNCGKIKEEMQNLRKQFTENFHILKKNIMSASDVVKGYREKCQDLEKQAREYTSLQAQLEASYEETAKVRQLLKKANDSIESQAKKIIRCETEIKFSRAQVEELEIKLAEEESKVTKLSVASGSSETSNENGGLKRELKEQTAAAEKLRKSNTSLEKKIAKLNETIKEIKETARAKVKEAKGSGTRKEVTKLKERLQKSQNTISQLRRQLKDLKVKNSATRTKARISKKIVLPAKPSNPHPTPKTDDSSSSSESEAEESQDNEGKSSDSSSSSEDENEIEEPPQCSKRPLTTPPSKSTRRTFQFMHEFAFPSAISPLPPSPALSKRCQGNRLEADQGLQPDAFSSSDLLDHSMTETDGICQQSTYVDKRVMEEWVESTASSETISKRDSQGVCCGSLSDSEESDREGSGKSNSGHESGAEVPGISTLVSKQTFSEDDSDQESLHSKTVNTKLFKECPSLNTQYDSLFGGCISDSDSSVEESSVCDTTCLVKKNADTPTDDTQQEEAAFVQHEVTDNEENSQSSYSCHVENDLGGKEPSCNVDDFPSDWRSSSLEGSKPDGNEVTRNKFDMDLDVGCLSSQSLESSTDSVFDESPWAKNTIDGNRAVTSKGKDGAAVQDLVNETARCNGVATKGKKMLRKVRDTTSFSRNERTLTREGSSSRKHEIDCVQDLVIKGSGNESIAQVVDNGVDVVSRSNIDNEHCELVKSGYLPSVFTQCNDDQDGSGGDGILTSPLHDQSSSSHDLPFHRVEEDPLNSEAVREPGRSKLGSVAIVAKVTSCGLSTTGTCSGRDTAQADSVLSVNLGTEPETACESVEGVLPLSRTSPDNPCESPMSSVSPILRSTSTSPFETVSCTTAALQSQPVLSEISNYGWTERAPNTTQPGLLLSFASIAPSSSPSNSSKFPAARTDHDVFSVVANARNVSPIQLLTSTVAISPLPATPTYVPAAVSPIPTTPVALAANHEVSVSTSISPLAVLPVRSCSVLSPLPCSPPIQNTMSPLSTTPIRDPVISPLPCSPVTHERIEASTTERSREILPLSSRSQPSPPILKDNVSREAEFDIFKPVAISRRSARALNFDSEDSCTQATMQLSHDRGSQLRLLVDSHDKRKMSAFSETKRMTPEAESTTSMPSKGKDETFFPEEGDKTLPGTSWAASNKSSKRLPANKCVGELPVSSCRPNSLEDNQAGNSVDAFGSAKTGPLTESLDKDARVVGSNGLKDGIKPFQLTAYRNQDNVRSCKRLSRKQIIKPEKSLVSETLQTNGISRQHLRPNKSKPLGSCTSQNSLDKQHLGNPKGQDASQAFSGAQHCKTAALETSCADTFISEALQNSTKAPDCPQLHNTSDSTMTEGRETRKVTPAVGDVGVAASTMSMMSMMTKCPATKHEDSDNAGGNTVECSGGDKGAIKGSIMDQESYENCSSLTQRDGLALAQGVSDNRCQPLDKVPMSAENEDYSRCETQSNAKPAQVGLKREKKQESSEFDNSNTDGPLQSRLGCRPTTRARVKVLEMVSPEKVNPATPSGRKRRAAGKEKVKKQSLGEKKTDSVTSLSNTPCESPSTNGTPSNSISDGGVATDVSKAPDSKITPQQDVDIKNGLEDVKALDASTIAVAAAQACSLSKGIKRSKKAVESDRTLRSCKRLRREQLGSESATGKPGKEDVTLLNKTGKYSTNGEGLDQGSERDLLNGKASAEESSPQINLSARSSPSSAKWNQKESTPKGVMPAQVTIAAAKAANLQASKTKSAKERAIEFLRLQKVLTESNSQTDVSNTEMNVKEPKLSFKRPLNGRRLKPTPHDTSTTVSNTTVSKTLQGDNVKPSLQSGAPRVDRISDDATSLKVEKTRAMKKCAEKHESSTKCDSVQNPNSLLATPSPEKKSRLESETKTSSDTAIRINPSEEKGEASQTSSESTAKTKQGFIVQHTMPNIHPSVASDTQSTPGPSPAPSPAPAPAPECDLPVRLRSTNELQYAKDCLAKLINGETTAAIVASRFRMAGCISLPRTLATAFIACLKAAKEPGLLIDYKAMLEEYDFDSNEVCKKCSQPVYTKLNYLNTWESLDYQVRSNVTEVKFFGTGGALLFPVMTCAEKALLQVVRETSKEGRMRDLPLALMRLLPRCIMGDPSLPAHQTTSMCRLFAGLCSITGQLHRLRTFIYDIEHSYKQITSIPRLLLSILLVWPEVLQHYHCVSCQERDKSPLSYSIKFVALKKAVHGRVKILKILESVLNMKNPKETIEEEIEKYSESLSALVTDKYEETEIKAFQTVRSLDLVVGWLAPESLQHRIADLCACLRGVFSRETSKLSIIASDADRKLCIQRLLLLAIYCKHAIQHKRVKLEPVLELCQQLLAFCRSGNAHMLARSVDLLLVVSPRHERFVSSLLHTKGSWQNPAVLPRTVFAQLNVFLAMVRQ